MTRSNTTARKNLFSIRPLVCACGVVLSAAGLSAQGATITWDAGDDGVSIYKENNWTALDGLPGTNPPADTVNPATNILVDMIVGGAATAGGPTGAGNFFNMADGVSLTVRDNAVFRMQEFNTGMQNFQDGGLTASLIIEDNGAVFVRFISQITVTMSGASELEFFGGGTPIANNSTVDLASDWTGEVRFNNELTADVTAEHLGNITVGGNAAVLGVNVAIVDNIGSTGSTLTVIPEPSSLALLALGGLAIARRRRA